MDSSLAWFQEGSISLGYSLPERDICLDFRFQARPRDSSSRSRGLQLILDPGLPSVLGFLPCSAVRNLSSPTSFHGSTSCSKMLTQACQLDFACKCRQCKLPRVTIYILLNYHLKYHPHHAKHCHHALSPLVHPMAPTALL